MDKELAPHFYTKAEKATEAYCDLPDRVLYTDEYALVHDVLSDMFAAGIVEIGENL